MNGSLRSIFALALMIAVPAATLAQNHHGGGGQGRGGQGNGGNHGSNSGPSRPPAPPVVHNQGPPPSRPPAPPVVHNQGGFNFPRDINARPITVQHQPVRTVTGNGNRPFVHYVQSPVNVTGGPYRGRFHGPVIRNPRHWGGWGWNRGIVWYPAPIYWGGGFWGSWAIDSLAAAILFGAIADYQNQVIYPSYEVTPDSPGAELLENYGLQQTPCGPPNLVVIWGPYNSVICAYPNNLVAPGNYELDPTTLTITSSS